MNDLMPYTTTATEIQRNYKKVMRMVKRLNAPMIVLRNNKPEAVLMSYEYFQKNYAKYFPHRKFVDKSLWGKV